MVKKMRPGSGPTDPDDVDRVVCDGCGVELPIETADLSAEEHWCGECTERNHREEDAYYEFCAEHGREAQT